MARIAFLLHTAGQAHLWHAVASALRSDGHDVFMVARGDERVISLLDHYGEPHLSYGNVGGSQFTKLLSLPLVTMRAIRAIHRWNADVIVGTGLMEAYSGLMLQKPVLIFEDAELTPWLERMQWKRLATRIVTPQCFKRNLGCKQVRFNGYKELAYLHPAIFAPEGDIWQSLGLEPGEHFVLLRYGSFRAVHDIGRGGIPDACRVRLAEELSKSGRVFISAEGQLPTTLEAFRLPTPFWKIHDVLYAADLLVCDTGTMAWEAAVLGTPSVVCGSFVHHFGNFDELADKYGLLFRTTDPEHALRLSVALALSMRSGMTYRPFSDALLRGNQGVLRFLCSQVLAVQKASKSLHSDTPSDSQERCS